MSDDAAGALGVIILIVFLAPIAIAIFVLWVIFNNADEIAEALAVIGKGIWMAHLYVGYTILWLVRDLPVRMLATDEWESRSVRVANIVWLVALPPVLFIGLWILLAGLFVGNQAAAMLFLAPSLGAMVYGYYTGYFERPVHHHRWPRFMAELYMMRAEGQLAYVERLAGARFWVANRKQKVQDLVAEE